MSPPGAAGAAPRAQAGGGRGAQQDAPASPSQPIETVSGASFQHVDPEPLDQLR